MREGADREGTVAPRTARTARVAAGALAAAVAAATAACGVTGGDGRPDVPPLESRCEACHDVASLSRAGAGEGLAAADWAAQAAPGLVRQDPLFPEPGTWWAVPWPRRGRHDDGAACGSCHPVQADGTGHGLCVYPDPASAFAGGTDCAAACHAWIPAAGSPGGTERPGEVLAAGDDAHARLWREGARPGDPTAFRISSFQPGCGGCHNVTSESHGAILTCLDCHDFGGDDTALHRAHVAAAGDGACAGCHVSGGRPSDAARRACLGCHPSGHRPRTGP